MSILQYETDKTHERQVQRIRTESVDADPTLPGGDD